MSECFVCRACWSANFDPNCFHYGRGQSSLVFSSGVCQIAVRTLRSIGMHLCFNDPEGDIYIQVVLPDCIVLIDYEYVLIAHRYFGGTIVVRLDLDARTLSLTVDTEPELS